MDTFRKTQTECIRNKQFHIFTTKKTHTTFGNQSFVIKLFRGLYLTGCMSLRIILFGILFVHTFFMILNWARISYSLYLNFISIVYCKLQYIGEVPVMPSAHLNLHSCLAISYNKSVGQQFSPKQFEDTVSARENIFFKIFYRCF